MSVDGKASVLATVGFPALEFFPNKNSKAAFFKLWSADHKWSSGSALVVLLA